MNQHLRRAAAVAIVLGAAGRHPATPAPLPTEPAPGRAVVVELFTSQGCATCPPADRLLAALGREAGGKVVPLAFHVDSWNHAGWTDPFSDAAWSRRHSFYARALRTDGAYTPQAVVNGSVAVVGSDEAALRAAIAAAARQPAVELGLALTVEPAEVRAEVTVEVPPALSDRKLDLMLAVFETGLETPVRRGENGGRTLRDDYVVRHLARVARLAPTAGEGPGTRRHSAVVRLAADWNRARLGLAAFVQDPRTLAIQGGVARELERSH